jgi:ABC-type multidrug transport system fused ATPase/permease subunit
MDTISRSIACEICDAACQVLYYPPQHLLGPELRSLVLFQDFKIWPFTLGENIGLGDPERMDDADTVEQAAQLGGALEFVERLPGGLDHYLRRPVRDYYSQLPEGTKMLFGREVDYGRLRGMGGMANTNSSSLSGGQMQRLAV